MVTLMICMILKKKQIVKEHSLNPVPFIAVSNNLKIKAKKINLSNLTVSSLADLAPTVLKVMDLKNQKR